MQRFILAAIRCSLMFLVTASLFFLQPAQAGYIVTLHQIGNNLTATGSGAINLTGLTFQQTAVAFDGGGIAARLGVIATGPSPNTNPILDWYSGATGPASFGTGPNYGRARFGSRDFVAIYGLYGLLFVPHGYVSGDPLSDSMTLINTGILPLGMKFNATYEWTWGNGADQTFTLITGPRPGVPDTGSTVSLLGLGLLGLAALRRNCAAKLRFS
jgi:hypothetical protein